MSSSKRNLRLITYLSPGLPVEWFETVLEYLEEVTQSEGYLIHESRWTGPPPERTDPFTADTVDIGFMSSTRYMQMYRENNSNIQLCEAAPVHQHSRGENRPIYFSEVIIKADKKTNYKHFHDLRGHSFAYNDPKSLSGSLVVLGELKKMGFNSSFFGNIMHSGSHLNSIQFVLENKTDAAAVDSSVLTSYLKRYPDRRSEISVLTSFGPMPIYPVVFNARLPSDLKKKITDALLEMNRKPEWQLRLADFGVKGFVPVDHSLYDMETEIVDLVKGHSISSAYY